MRYMFKSGMDSLAAGHACGSALPFHACYLIRTYAVGIQTELVTRWELDSPAAAGYSSFLIAAGCMECSFL
jgi:hypothetical protein